MTHSAPYRADQVGSLLRPESLHQARRDFKEGKISKETLREAENHAIQRIVEKQIEIGLPAVTDGEFRRSWWHYDFLEHLNGMEGYVSTEGRPFKGIQTERYNVRNIGKVAFNPDHPFIEEFKIFHSYVNGRAAAKLTIPSPNQLFVKEIRNRELYPDIEDYAKDVIQTYKDAIQAFYEAGVRYLQLDDVYIASLASDEEPYSDESISTERLIELAVKVINGSLEDKPEDLYVTTHLCRGNYRSKWAFQGSYARIAPQLFAKAKFDGFFLEYDDERSGDFKALDHIPQGGAKVVLGLVTSKTGELEDKEAIIARIKEAAEHVPLDQLALSTQCGFSSTHHGNELTEEDQWNKLKLVMEIAKDVWGTVY